MEKLIRKRIVDHMNKYGLFSDRQFGFIGGRSTGLQLLKVLDHWTEILDNGGSIDAIYTDFMKAFDKMSTKRKNEVPDQQEPKRRHTEVPGQQDPVRKKVFDHIYGNKFWGPYLSERQWCTVREETLGNCWDSTSYEKITLDSYRWGEDGIFGLCDEQQQLCMGLTLWNGKDSVVKERFFGLTGPQGNHGEDVKELYFYLDNDPDHRYMKALYLYPQTEFPYTELIEQNKGRSPGQSEYEILDTGVFDDSHWQIMVEYIKPENDTILCRYTVTNISNEVQTLNLSPKFWFRHEYDAKQMSNVPCFQVKGDESAVSVSYQLGEFCVNFSKSSSGQSPEIKLKRNHSNTKPDCCYAAYTLEVEPGGQDIIEWELLPVGKHSNLDNSSNVIQEWKIKAETFYNSLYDCQWSDQEKTVAKGAWAGLLWNKQFYYYDVDEWYNRGQATVKPGNWDVMERNIKWRKHFKAKDILSVPDKWEFPWLPGCEFNFDDNNPPIHAWTSLKVFQMTGGTDLNFLFNSYCKLQKNYNWWMTNLQCSDRYIFYGGFLGLDNISVVDRGCPPEGYTIKQVMEYITDNIKCCRQRGCQPEGYTIKQTEWGVHQRDIQLNRYDYITDNISVVDRGCPPEDIQLTGMEYITDNISVVDRGCPSDGYTIKTGMEYITDYISVVDRGCPPEGYTIKQADATTWMALFAISMVQIGIELIRHNFPSPGDIQKDLVRYLKDFLCISNQLNKDIDNGGMWNPEMTFYNDVLIDQLTEQYIPIQVRSLVGLLPLVACGTVNL
ncbi:Uncharacterized protein YMR196W [Mytilus edulis]|uniref:Uncharacterized protein YMR196W n=1 Tax=Mytilus edulis TaxID=6550 RepID=A0A8S3PR42_MYTED|nr:Uncharacterized protein YMR196W [Mytilus edulis]